MLTNVFRLGGLQQVSWFQFIPTDGDGGAMPVEKWQAELLAKKLLNAHIKLQKDGHLSAWTCNTLGAHDVSTLKLWLFFPGRVETFSPTVQSTILGLKVNGSGLCSLARDLGEVGAALCQALRNCIERGLRSVGYMRFGDVFVKCKTLASNEPRLRKPLLTCEVIFTASEEAIFLHFVLQRMRVRTLSVEDMQEALKSHLDGSDNERSTQTVVVAPHGLSGQLTGCYSGDLVNGLYESSKSKSRLPHDLPLHLDVSCYHGSSLSYGVHAEVFFGLARKARPVSSSATTLSMVTTRSLASEQAAVKDVEGTSDRCKEILTKRSSHVERIMLYPPEAVLVPFVPLLPARTFLKRSWMQRWSGTTWIEEELHAWTRGGDSSLSGTKEDKVLPHERMEDQPVSASALYGVKSPSSKSSSSSTSSSGGSSVENSSSHGSGTSSDSAGERGGPPGELDADAESLVAKGNTLDALASSKWGHVGGTVKGDVTVLRAAKKSSSSGGEVSNDISRSLQNRTDAVSGMGLSPNVGIGTPKAASSQVGTPWDWPEDERGLGMGIENDADILAEFGDFGDFFENDGLGFGEPPGTAESQAMIFPLTDCVEGITSPGNGCLDFSDPMLLPILDIPAFEGLGQQPFGKDDKGASVMSEDIQIENKSPEAPESVGEDSLSKAEAVLLLAPGYDPVSFRSGTDTHPKAIFKSPYLPESRKMQTDNTRTPDCYKYSPTPPPSPKAKGLERKREHYEIVSSRDFLSRKIPKVASGTKFVKGKLTSLHGYGSRLAVKSGQDDLSSLVHGQRESNFHLPQRALVTTLATDVECYALQFTFLRVRNEDLNKYLSILTTRCPAGGFKESNLDIVSGSDSSICVSKTSTKQHERRKKDKIPSRIAGGDDEEVQDAPPPVSQFGVWRPVGTPKSQNVPHTLWNDSLQASSEFTPNDLGAFSSSDNAPLVAKPSYWQEIMDAIPLLVQQGSASFDVAFDGDSGDGPFGWLISQEQERHKRICGPNMAHAGCGGMLSAAHFVDNAGVELLNPLVYEEISAASVATMLQSDIRLAMATAFEDAHLGPLTLGEWLRGRVMPGDSLASDSLASDSKETMSTITVGIGEPITPPQCTTGGPLGVKASIPDVEIQACDGHRSNSSWVMEVSSLSDDGCSRRCTQEAGSIESDIQPGGYRGGPTVLALPMPSLLVGYQDDWLKVSTSTLHLWEKAPLEPYATAKPVTYYVLCPRIDSLLSATADYLHQLSCVYEACRLGTHVAGNNAYGQTGFPATPAKHGFSGFTVIDFPMPTSQMRAQSSGVTPLGDYVMNFDNTWNAREFRKALRRACKALPISASSNAQRESETGPCLVYYVVCPSSDPEAVLQTMIAACQIIGHNIAASDKERKSIILNQTHRSLGGSGFVHDYSNVASHGVIGFSTSKHVLQVLTAENILKASHPIAVEVDSLKEVAFTVYNKIRRIPRGSSSSDPFLPTTSQLGRGRPLTLQSGVALTGMWKDCTASRTTTLLGQETLLESTSFRNNSWDNAWAQQGTPSEMITSSNSDGQLFQDGAAKYLFEPLFILAEPGNAVGSSTSRPAGYDELSASVHPGSSETMHGTVTDSGSESDMTGGGTRRVANLHCCYGWTEDWKWLISVWTDARGEPLDVHLFPVSGGRWETKGLHNLFGQIILHGCQLLLLASGAGSPKARSMVISRVGAFYDLECQEWQKAVFAVGGIETRKWPVQIWQQSTDTSSVSMGSSTSYQPQDMSTLAERTLNLAGSIPSSPVPSTSIFGSRSKALNLVKAEIGGPSTPRKLGVGALGQSDACRGAFQLVHSISFISVVLDHSLQIVGPPDAGSQSGVPQNSLSSSHNANMLSSLGTGVGLVKTLASTTASYLLIPAHGLRSLCPLSIQSQLCSVAPESPALGQLIQKSGLATTVASAFVVSRAVPSIRTELTQRSMEEWPSILSVGLVGYMSSFSSSSIQLGQSTTLGGTDTGLKAKMHAKSLHSNNNNSSGDGWDQLGSLDVPLVLETLAAELQALSWLTVSPTYPFRRTGLPFHCNVVQRLRRLLHYADGEVGGLQDS